MQIIFIASHCLLSRDRETAVEIDRTIG